MTVNTRVSPSCTVADESSVDNCSSRSQASTAAPGSARGCQCCTACSWPQSLPDLYKDVPVRVGASAIDTQVVTDGLRPEGCCQQLACPGPTAHARAAPISSGTFCINSFSLVLMVSSPMRCMAAGLAARIGTAGVCSAHVVAIAYCINFCMLYHCAAARGRKQRVHVARSVRSPGMHCVSARHEAMVCAGATPGLNLHMSQLGHC